MTTLFYAMTTLLFGGALVFFANGNSGKEEEKGRLS